MLLLPIGKFLRSPSSCVRWEPLWFWAFWHSLSTLPILPHALSYFVCSLVFYSVSTYISVLFHLLLYYLFLAVVPALSLFHPWFCFLHTYTNQVNNKNEWINESFKTSKQCVKAKNYPINTKLQMFLHYWKAKILVNSLRIFLLPCFINKYIASSKCQSHVKLGWGLQGLWRPLYYTISPK